MSRAFALTALALTALTAAGCASTRPPPAPVAVAPAPPPPPPPPSAAAPAPFAPRPTPLDQLGAEAKLAVFPGLSLTEIAEPLTRHAARCWRGPGAPFAALDDDAAGLTGRDGSGAEVLRVRYAAISPTLNAVAFSGPAFDEALEMEAADAVRGRSLCAGEIPNAASGAPLA